jgi:hypothetical protein
MAFDQRCYTLIADVVKFNQVFLNTVFNKLSNFFLFVMLTLGSIYSLTQVRVLIDFSCCRNDKIVSVELSASPF